MPQQNDDLDLLPADEQAEEEAWMYFMAHGVKDFIEQYGVTTFVETLDKETNEKLWREYNGLSSKE
jgi:hypothetical protein